MKKCSIYLRGQVWHWIDPIYGDKPSNMSVHKGECTLRYSRYVVIAQTTKTINHLKSVLVIPCSSKNNDKTDVELLLAHTSCLTRSYAKPNMIFPISPSFLDEYICTIPDEAMTEIDKHLTNLLLHCDYEEDEIDSGDLVVIDPAMYQKDDQQLPAVVQEVLEKDNNQDGEFKEVIEAPVEEVVDIQEPDEVIVYETYDGGIKVDTVRASAAKFSHMIVRYLKSEKVFNIIAHKQAKNKSKMNTFYSCLDEAIFKSLISFLGIKVDGQNIEYPEVDYGNPDINTWLFLSRIYNDRRISHERVDPILLISAYRNYYTDKIIDHAWRDTLWNFVENKLHLNQNQMQYIIQIIVSNFCEPM